MFLFIIKFFLIIFGTITFVMGTWYIYFCSSEGTKGKLNKESVSIKEIISFVRTRKMQTNIALFFYAYSWFLISVVFLMFLLNNLK